MNDILESVQFEEFFEALKDSMRRSKSAKAAWDNPSDAMLLAQQLKTQLGLKKWREEHPEEVGAQYKKAIAAAHKWQREHPEELQDNLDWFRPSSIIATAKWWKEHPEVLERWKVGAAKWRATNSETLLANLKKGRTRSLQWRKEHPEEFAANMERWKAAGDKWRKENPEKARDHLENIQAIAAKWRKENPEKLAAFIAKANQVNRNRDLEIYLGKLRFIKPLITKDGIRLIELTRLCPQWTRIQLKAFLRKAVQRQDLIPAGPRWAMRYYVPTK